MNVRSTACELSLTSIVHKLLMQIKLCKVFGIALIIPDSDVFETAVEDVIV